MNIYRLKHLDDHEILYLKNEEDYFRLRMLEEKETFTFNGKDNYSFSSIDNKHKRLKTEFPNFENNNFLLMKTKAFNCFNQILSPYGNFFNVQSKGEEDIYFFRPLLKYDILNIEKSRILMFDPQKDKGYLKKVVLNNMNFDEALIFKVKQSFSPIFVNQVFVDIYNQNYFTGLEFEEVEEN